MDMNERQKKAFDFVSDYAKQLITLATGVITFMVTFLQEELRTGTEGSKRLLVGSWILFIISILGGIWRLMALTGNLDPRKGSPQLTITTNNVRVPGFVQIFAFFFAIVLSCIFGCNQIFEAKKKDPKDKTIIILQQQIAPGAKVLSVDTIYPVRCTSGLKKTVKK